MTMHDIQLPAHHLSVLGKLDRLHASHALSRGKWSPERDVSKLAPSPACACPARWLGALLLSDL